ncbi:MAG: ribbon-helix-helix protein, CopG family, partial [Verrucomicrobia bacterium]|nr:ribbon-helix-helix protein, CopG family [Verrucomicrobiota bacterium]
SVKLPESLANWLAGEAKATRRSRSAIVREALDTRRNGHGKRRRLTMAEAMADLRGTISGPRDLSTNPRHLENLGR